MILPIETSGKRRQVLLRDTLVVWDSFFFFLIDLLEDTYFTILYWDFVIHRHESFVSLAQLSGSCFCKGELCFLVLVEINVLSIVAFRL